MVPKFKHSYLHSYSVVAYFLEIPSSSGKHSACYSLYHTEVTASSSPVNANPHRFAPASYDAPNFQPLPAAIPYSTMPIIATALRIKNTSQQTSVHSLFILRGADIESPEFVTENPFIASACFSIFLSRDLLPVDFFLGGVST